MYKKIVISAILLLFLLSCGKVKRAVEHTVISSEETVDSIGVVDEDTIFLIDPPEPALPTTGNESFEDFIAIFAADSLFQHSRIVFPLPHYEGESLLKVEKEDWVHDALFVNQTYYTLLLDGEKALDHTEELDHTYDGSQTSVQMEAIDMKTHQVKRYYFERVNGRWMLEAINQRPIIKAKRAEFVDFFVRFAVDTLYQAKHIREPLKFVTTDPDDDFSIIETTLDAEQWFAFKPVLPEERLFNIIYGSETTDETSHKILQLKGIGNGFLNTLYFRYTSNGQWELYKFEDTSN